MSDGDQGQYDWFGNPVQAHTDRAPVTPVACPKCGDPFTSSDALRAHLAAAHGVTQRTRRTGPTPPAGRFRRWVNGLAYLPFWFVVPLNLGVTAVLAIAWWDQVELLTMGDQTALVKAWILRLSLLPVTCYLAARVATPSRA